MQDIILILWLSLIVILHIIYKALLWKMIRIDNDDEFLYNEVAR